MKNTVLKPAFVYSVLLFIGIIKFQKSNDKAVETS